LSKGNLTDETCKQIELTIKSWRTKISRRPEVPPSPDMSWLTQALSTHTKELNKLCQI
jgi:hypothetical protein